MSLCRGVILECVSVICNIDSLMSVCNNVCPDYSSKRKWASGLDICKRELGQCREELRVSLEENVRLSDVVASLTTLIFELKRQIERYEQSVGSCSRHGETTIENMDVSKELEECKAMVIELGADKNF